MVDVKDINDTLAEQFRSGIDPVEYGPNGQLRDPQVETLMAVSSRPLPWWSGTSRDGGQIRFLNELATAAEALTASGLDWQVDKKAIYVGRKGARIENKYATVRDSDGKALGVVGSTYRVIQNDEAFAFCDALVDSGEAKFETAGSLRGGAVVFMSMELDHLDVAIKIAGKKDRDEVRIYGLFTNAHDGSGAARAMITPIRTVCVNTCRIAKLRAHSEFAIRHTGDPKSKLLAARETLGISFRYMEEWSAAAEKLASKKLVDAQVEEIFRTAIWPVTDNMPEGRLENHASTKAFENYLASETIDNIRGTAWGAYNAVTEYVDHGQEYRGRSNSKEDVRTDSILWGRGQIVKDRAYIALSKV
jgi:phage/plasmid-like protein (TIGR03299 family)